MGKNEDAAELVKLLDDYEADPSLFVEEVLGVPRQIVMRNGVPFGQTDQQKALLASVAQPGSKTSVKSGHGCGKTTDLAWIVLWALTVFQNVKVPCTAPSGHQLEDVLWAEIAKWHTKMHPYFKEQIEVKADRVVVKSNPKNEFAVARTARKENPDALQGFHADVLIFLIDEAPGVDEKVFEVARGALSTPNARVVMVGNPTQTTGYFFESHNRNRNNWNRLTFSCLDSPLVDPSYPKEIADEYGEDSDMYRVRVLGEFPRASIMQLIAGDLVDAAMSRTLREDQYSYAPVILGGDVNYFGDDRAAIFKRQGLASWLLWQGRNVDTTQYASIMANFEDQHKADAVNIDATGWGAGVVDAGRSWGRNWNAVMFGGSSADPTCFNKRAECWWKTLQWLKDGGVLPNVPDLRTDLTGPQFFYARSSNKLQLERKEDMKKRGLASPDLAEALVLTFAVPVIAKGEGGPNGFRQKLQFAAASMNPFSRNNVGGQQFANASYNLFRRR